MSQVNTHQLGDPRPRWSRALHASLRDARRIHLEAEQRIEQMILASGLSTSLTHMVRTIASDAALLTNERIAVAEELLAHFADGLDSGQSPETLAQDFGDPEQASRLIGRAQQRKRTGIGRYVSRSSKIAGGMLLALLLIYGFLAVRFFLGTPVPSHDYLADLNKPMHAAPVEQHAWPVYREALLMLTPPPPLHAERAPMPGEQGWDELAAYLQVSQPAIERAAIAAAMPVMGYEYNFGIAPEDTPLFIDAPTLSGINESDDPQTLIAVLLPHLGALRQFSKIMADDVRRAVVDDDLDAAVRNLSTMLGMADQLLATQTLIEQLVAYAIANMAFERLGEIPAQTPWTPDQLAQLSAAIGGYGNGQRIIANIDGERAMFRDVIQHTYTDDGSGDGRITWAGHKLLQQLASSQNVQANNDYDWYEDVLANALLPAASFVTASRREQIDKYDELISELEAECAQPAWLRVSNADERMAAMVAQDRQRYYPVTMLLPAIGKVFTSSDQTTMQRDGARVAVAAMAYRAEHGQWPASLDELVGSHLDEAPLDQFTGKPLGFVLCDGQPVVYSVGADGDDDAGTPAAEQSAARTSPNSSFAAQRDADVQGDWILWPHIAAHEPLEYDRGRSLPMYNFAHLR